MGSDSISVVEGVGRVRTGKSVALRVLSGERGGQTEENPLVSEARTESREPLTEWRLAYNLPPSDPAVLEITEEEAIFDLLVRHFYFERYQSPEEKKADDMARHPEAVKRLIEAADGIQSILPPPKPKEPVRFYSRRHRVNP